MEENKVGQFLIVVCKLRYHNSKIGPYDSVKLLIKADATFSLLVYDQKLVEGVIEGPLSLSSLVPVLDKLANAQLVVCAGISDYSEIKASIGYDVRGVVPVSCPPYYMKVEKSLFYVISILP